MHGLIKKDCVLNPQLRNWLEGGGCDLAFRPPPPGVQMEKVWAKDSAILVLDQDGRPSGLRDFHLAKAILQGIKVNGWRYLEEIIFPFRLFWMDLEKGRWILARAPNEASPIFWHASPDLIAFSEDALGALELSGNRPRVNWERIPEYMVFQDVAGGETLYRDIRVVTLGEVVEGKLGSEEMAQRSLWPGWLRRIREEGMDCLEEALVASIQSLVLEGENERTGLFLSGGVDSSVLAWALTKAGISSLEAFTVSCPGCVTDEAPYAMKVALALGLLWNPISLTPTLCASSLVQAIKALRMPMVSTNQVAWWLLCQEASKAGIKRCFSGEGCDGWVSGGLYDEELEGLQRLMNRGLDHVAMAGVTPKAHLLNRPEVIRGVMDVPLDLSSRISLWKDCWHLAQGSPSDAALLYHVRTAGSRLLGRAALVAGFHHISLCLPYLDREFLGWVLSIPWGARNPPGERKKPLKGLCECLYGSELAYRRKIGFPFPLRTWLRDSKERIIQELRGILLDARTLQRTIYRPRLALEVAQRLKGELRPIDWLLWSLLNLELWLREVEGENDLDDYSKSETVPS